MLASVIINSSDLLRVDLTGIHVILPRLLSALEDLQQKFKLVVLLMFDVIILSASSCIV